MTLIRTDTPPLSGDEAALLCQAFHRDGFVHLPGILSPDEVAALKAGIDRVFSEPRFEENRYGSWIAVRLFETDPLFEEMLTREPVIGLVERLLGPDCHLIAQNVVRNAPGQAIDTFHADDVLMIPVGEGMERHDPRMQMPVYIVGVQMPLTDIEAEEYGPTQFVPGSHYAGRHPNDPKSPTFEGRGPVSVLCRAGDIYLQNGQCWHRGAPNDSDRTRYLFQMAFGVRWVSQRFYPFVNYRLREDIIARADARRKRVLGFHPKGAYG